MMITAIYKGVENWGKTTRESEVPSLITKLGNYFDILYPNNKEGN